jgi:uncharacterized RDD family membrane protein YckC
MMRNPQEMQTTRPLITAAYLARRSTAYLIDVGMLAGAAGLVQALLALMGAGLPAAASGLQVEAWVLVTVSLPVWLYFIGLEHLTGATLGKRLLGLRVERASGGRLSLGRAWLRTALKLLPWELTHITLLLPTPIWSAPNPGFRLGFIAVYALLGLYLAAAALTPRRQSLPDLAAGALVTVNRPGDSQ